jgi:hypothetical protein
MKKSSNFKTSFVSAAVITALLTFMGVATASANVSVSGDNHMTGPYSRNQSMVNLYADKDFEIWNTSDFDNNFSLEVNSGENCFEFGTEIGDISTGDISASIDVNNQATSADLTMSEIVNLDCQDNGTCLVGTGDVTLDFANSTTGPFSDNTNEADIYSNANVNIHNDTDVDNHMDVSANTGDNYISRNTSVGNVGTGDISISSDTTNTIGSGLGSAAVAGLVNLDSTTVSADMTNDLTGPDSENKNTLNVHHNTDVNIQNKADMDNCVSVDANTGHNKIGNNTVVGNVTTGSVNIDLSTSNMVN